MGRELDAAWEEGIPRESRGDLWEELRKNPGGYRGLRLKARSLVEIEIFL